MEEATSGAPHTWSSVFSVTGTYIEHSTALDWILLEKCWGRGEAGHS